MLQVTCSLLGALYADTYSTVIRLPTAHCRMALLSAALRWKAALLRVKTPVTRWQAWSILLSAVSAIPARSGHLY